MVIRRRAAPGSTRGDRNDSFPAVDAPDEEYVGRKNHPPNPKGRAGERRPRRKDVDSGIGG